MLYKEEEEKSLRMWMTGISTFLSIIFLNVSGLDSPINRPRLAGWI